MQVGISLLWNAFGAWDYLQTQLVNRDYFASMTQPMGIDPDTAIAYYEAFPAWMDAAWALGVWGAVLGSVLLLLRKRFALIAFMISFFGLVVGTLHGIANPLPGQTDSAGPMIFTAVLWVIAIALILYSRRMIAHNHLN
jgi:hypothetical protein